MSETSGRIAEYYGRTFAAHGEIPRFAAAVLK